MFYANVDYISELIDGGFKPILQTAIFRRHTETGKLIANLLNNLPHESDAHHACLVVE